jgi:hypothetical protein
MEMVVFMAKKRDRLAVVYPFLSHAGSHDTTIV